MSGWISIHRKIQNHWLWDEKPFDKRSAWFDLLMMVNHEDKKVLLGKELIEVKRGSRITSIRKLCDRWGWSNTKVRGFLELLERDNMLVVKSDTKKTTLTIVNYNDYQISEAGENNTKTTSNFLEVEKIIKNSDTKTTLGDIGNSEFGGFKEVGKRQENDIETSRKHTNNNDNNDNNIIFNYSEKLKNVVSLLQNNIGVIPPIQIELISEYVDIFDLDMFAEAVKIACNKKVRTVHYTLGILRQWQDNNIITISDLEALREEKKVKSNQPNPSTLAKKTKFHNFEQRSGNYSADELEDIARRKRAAYKERMNQENREEKSGNESLLDI